MRLCLCFCFDLLLLVYRGYQQFFEFGLLILKRDAYEVDTLNEPNKLPFECISKQTQHHTPNDCSTAKRTDFGVTLSKSTFLMAAVICLVVEPVSIHERHRISARC